MQRQRPTRVLIVEDDPDLREVFWVHFVDRGHDVRVTDDPLVALAEARAWRPHIVLLDLVLGHADGWQLARDLRELDVTQGACVIGITGHATEENVARGYAAGCAEVLAKPIDLDALAAFVDGVAAARCRWDRA